MIDDRQQNASSTIWNTPTLFPILYGTYIKTESLREFLTAQPQAFPKRKNPFRGRVVNNAARKFNLPAHMG